MDREELLLILAAVTSITNLVIYLRQNKRQQKRDRALSSVRMQVARIGSIEDRLRCVEYQANSNKNNIMAISAKMRQELPQ